MAKPIKFFSLETYLFHTLLVEITFVVESEIGELNNISLY